MAEATEITHICIDNSLHMHRLNPAFTAQLEAIELWCKTKFKCNPNHLVGLYAMSNRRSLLSPTNNLQQILRSVKGVHSHGDAEFSLALMDTAGDLLLRPPSMKKNLLMFVGGPIYLDPTLAMVYGVELRKVGIAVNVVNFFVVEGGRSSLIGTSMLHGKYRYAMVELNLLCDTANHNDISCIVDVKDPSSVCEILSNSILKKDLLYLKEKHQEENVNVKQQSELSHTESVNVKALGIQNSKPQLE